MKTVLGQCFKRELLSLKRQPGRWLNPVLFYLLVITLFAIGLGGDVVQLHAVGLSVIWVAVLLSCFLSAESFYAQDFQDGTLKQYLLWPIGMPAIILIKYVVHWFFYVIPLCVLIPLACLMLAIPSHEMLWVIAIILPGMSLLLLLTLLVSALTIGMHQSSSLLALLVLPFYVPVLILGNMWFLSVTESLPGLPFIALFVAMGLLALVFCPLGASFLIKLSMES